MRRLGIKRRTLLVEIERRCSNTECGAKARIGLTKEEARLYRGFECEQCKAWTEDLLSERDVPEWWEELALTDMPGLRPAAPANAKEGENNEVVTRMSDGYRRLSGK